MNRVSALAISFLAVMALMIPCMGAVQYQVVDLGAPQGSESHATGINSKGQVSGYWYSTSLQAFVWQNGVMTNLGTGYGYGINYEGEVVGWENEGCIWRNGVPMYLGDIGTPHYTWGFAINNNSQAVGYAYLRSYVDNAFISQNGVMTDIGTLGGLESRAYGINNNGQVVGWANPTNSDSVRRAFVWQNNVMTDLGIGAAFGINDSGVIVGNSAPYAGYASIWQNNTRTDIVMPHGGTFVDINNSGQVVGYSYSSGSITERAFLWQNGVLTDLNSLIAADSGWLLEGANAINDNGYIVGSGVIDGQTRAYLLVPVPEPSSLAVMCVGLVPLIRRRRR